MQYACRKGNIMKNRMTILRRMAETLRRMTKQVKALEAATASMEKKLR